MPVVLCLLPILEFHKSCTDQIVELSGCEKRAYSVLICSLVDEPLTVIDKFKKAIEL